MKVETSHSEKNLKPRTVSVVVNKDGSIIAKHMFSAENGESLVLAHEGMEMEVEREAEMDQEGMLLLQEDQDGQLVSDEGGLQGVIGGQGQEIQIVSTSDEALQSFVEPLNTVGFTHPNQQSVYTTQTILQTAAESSGLVTLEDADNNQDQLVMEDSPGMVDHSMEMEVVTGDGTVAMDQSVSNLLSNGYTLQEVDVDGEDGLGVDEQEEMIQIEGLEGVDNRSMAVQEVVDENGTQYYLVINNK